MALDHSRIKAICFDVDGTLSDTDDRWVSELELRLRPFRRLFPRGDPRAFARWAIMCAESPGNFAYQLLDRMHMDAAVGRVFNFLSRSQREVKPRGFWIIDGVQDTVRQLCQHYPLAVVSARGRAGTEGFLSQFELREHFVAVATALTCQYTKPFPDPILWAAKQMGVAPHNCLMVGDTTVDIRAGKAAGAQTAGVLCGFGTENELRRAGADIILAHTALLPDILLPPGGNQGLPGRQMPE